MSSSAPATDSVPAVPVVAEKPVRRVVTKRVPKAAAAAAAADANANANADAAPAVSDSTAVPAPAAPAVEAKVAKKRAPRKPKAAIVAATADASAAVAADASAAAPVDANDAAVADAAAPAAPAKRVRAAKPPRPVFIVAYGDLHVPEKLRSYTKEAFEAWKKDTALAVQEVGGIRYKEWVVAKRRHYQEQKKVNARAKRVTKRLDWEATARNHLNRLKEMPASDFEALENTWLSNYQFSGSFDAAYLEKEGCPADKGVVATYTIYLAALHHGFKPAGIVSENGTRSPSGEIVFTTSVDGKREYVGVALPFQSKERSKYSVIPADRVPSETVA